MPSLATSIRAVSFALLLSPPLSAPARAQSNLSHLDDAAPLPAGMLRLRIANVWTRFDERFAASGMSPLGAGLSTDSLGSAQLPRLLPVEAGLRTLAMDPALRLSLGRLQVASNARIVTTPLAIEFGLTRRLSVGILVPVVQTRRVAQAVVTGDATWANVGYVASGSRGAAAAANLAVATAYRSAADSLQRLLSNCPGNPSASGCAAVNANRADAVAARARAEDYAAGARALGATDTDALIAPRRSSDLADVLEARRIQLNQQLQQYLGAGAGAGGSVFFAPTDFSYIDLQGRAGAPALLGGRLGGGLDSIRTTEKIGFGDIAIGARFLLFDRFQYDSAPPSRIQSRLIVGGAVRLPTSRPDSALSLVDIPTGDGAGVELNTAWDAIVGRFGATVGARYAKSFARTVQAAVYGDPEADFPYPLFAPRARTSGDVLGLDLTPRLLLTESIALNLHYGLERIGATTYGSPEAAPTDPCPTCLSIAPLAIETTSGTARTAQRLGFGIRYSTVESFARGRARYPIEVSFVRLATVSGDPGVAKQTRDQLQLRLFYQLLRRR
jgi:hypothetical protein